MSRFLSRVPKIGLVAVINILCLSGAVAYCADFDGDGLTDQDETNIYHTDPAVADTDGDGITDGTEVAFWRKGWSADYDGDGLNSITRLRFR